MASVAMRLGFFSDRSASGDKTPCGRISLKRKPQSVLASTFFLKKNEKDEERGEGKEWGGEEKKKEQENV